MNRLYGEKSLYELEAEQKLLEGRLQDVKHAIFWRKQETKKLLGDNDD